MKRRRSERKTKEQEVEGRWSRTTWPGKMQVLRGLIDVGDGSVAVDLPNLGTQHVIILTELCFHCRAYLGWRFTVTETHNQKICRE